LPLCKHREPAQNASSRLSECTHRVIAQGPLLWVRRRIRVEPRVLLTSVIRASPVAIDQVVSDFDGVTFHISTPETKTKILVSISLRCYSELVKYGAKSVMEREYGSYIVSPENGYDFSVQVDLEHLPEDQGRHIRPR